MAMSPSQPSSIVILGFAIVLAVFLVNECVAEKFIAHFTTTPKDKEVFVGDSVQFDWDYKDDGDQVRFINFGLAGGPSGQKLTTLLRKNPGDDLVLYTNSALEIRSRTEVVYRRRASFRIKNVIMNDTGYFFCTLYPRDVRKKTLTKHVYMRVVDLQINDKASKTIVDSWEHQQISLPCVVRVTLNTPVEFIWQRQPDNNTVSRGQHYDTRKESILKLITAEDIDFTTYTCIAKTKTTTKSHNVVVRRLRGPGSPQNLQAQMIFKNGESYQKIFWSKPKYNGGAKITGYVIEYKPEGIGWDKATRAKTESTEFTKFNLKEGKTYNVRVKAKNKVREGMHSNEVDIKLDSFLSKGKISNISNNIKVTQWLHVLSLVMLLLFKTQVSFEWL